MARSSRWKDAASQAQPASPAPDATAHPMPPVSSGPAVAPQMPPFAPPLPVANANPPVNPFAPPAAPAPATPEREVAATAAAPPASGGTLPPLPVAAAPAASSPVVDDVAELRTTLQQLQATVATLVERAKEPTVPLGTPDTDQASRIIVMANRAAESTLEEARAEATEILAAAQAHSVEIISTARELADQELAAERVRVAAATAAWTERRAEIAAHLRELETALHGYRDGLGETAGAIREAAARLETERADPPVIDELPAPDPAAFVSTHLPPESEPVIDLTTSAPSSPPAADELAGSPRTSLFGGAAPADVAAAATATVAPAVPAAPTVERIAEAATEATTEPEAPSVVEESELAEPAEPTPPVAAPDEGPVRNLRPGLFGR